jgi:hypothetical protein
LRQRKIWLWAASGILALGLAGGARAALPMTYALQASAAPAVGAIYDIAVNKNPLSDYYGYVYVTDSGQSKVRILRPDRVEDGTGSAGLVDTGLTITSANPNTDNPVGVRVSDDGNVYTFPNARPRR